MASAESGCGSEGEGRVRDLLPACGPPSAAAPRLRPGQAARGLLGSAPPRLRPVRRRRSPPCGHAKSSNSAAYAAHTSSAGTLQPPSHRMTGGRERERERAMERWDERRDKEEGGWTRWWAPLILHHRIQPIVLHLAAPQPIVLPCAAPKGHGKQSSFPCAKGWHTAKRCLCRVSFVALGKIIIFFLFSL